MKTGGGSFEHCSPDLFLPLEMVAVKGQVLPSYNWCSVTPGPTQDLRDNTGIILTITWEENQPTHCTKNKRSCLYIWISISLYLIIQETSTHEINVFKNWNKSVQFYSICIVPMTVKRVMLLLCALEFSSLCAYPAWGALAATSSRCW